MSKIGLSATQSAYIKGRSFDIVDALRYAASMDDAPRWREKCRKLPDDLILKKEAMKLCPKWFE